MPKLLTIGSEEFEFPLEGENAGYGSEITDWAEAVTEALSTVQKPNDILTRTEVLNNNQGAYPSESGAGLIPGFTFSTAEVISIECRYFIKRITTGPAAALVETGYIEGYYDGTNWGISIRTTGDAQVSLSITPSGQIQYTSSDMPNLTYDGKITFEAKVINK